MTKDLELYRWTHKVIQSCTTVSHLVTADLMRRQYRKQWENRIPPSELTRRDLSMLQAVCTKGNVIKFRRLAKKG